MSVINNMNSTRKRKRKKPIVIIAIWIVLIASLCVVAYSGYNVFQIQREYEIGDSSYEDLRKKTVQLNVDPAVDADESIPQLSIDFDQLKDVNIDTVAWLYGPNTVIDYPVMRAEDYKKYLYTLPDGTYNANGSLFTDFNNLPDFSGRLNIIYGHHMNSGKMFGTLVNYKQQSYFDENPYMYLYTEEGNYKVYLKYGCVIGAGEWSENFFTHEDKLDSLLSYAKENTTFESKVDYTDSDKFLVLSTCSYEFDDARYVVIGVMKPEFS